MSASPVNARIYSDLAGLDALKGGANKADPAAIREVARQFESLFARIMIKSMRDAVGKDPIFGSDATDTYQGMFDDQLSIELTRGRGLGLADMLIQQLQRMGVAGATGGASASATATAAASPAAAPGTPAAQPPVASSATQASFVRELWPQAQAAGAQLGVDPRAVIAQAALETHWGQSVPHDSSGQSSNNLFGVKAGAAWAGGSVTAGTREFQGGTAIATDAQFRAYDSRAQSVEDYVALLRTNPHYAAALNAGGDVHAFAAALQRGGYATDPEYARKIATIASSLAPPPSPGPGETETSLKSAAPLPTQGGSGTT